jgi:DNA repair protein RecO (recombination protein O)
MEWRDEGLVLGIKRHGETSVILETMTAGHGRHLGLVKGGRSKQMQPLLQPGNGVDLVWRARLEEHLGFYAIEATILRAARLMEAPAALHAIVYMGALLRLMAEREPHPLLYAEACDIGAAVDAGHDLGARLVHFELSILAEAGFGLDLSSCAATGATEDLVFVSPRSGRAVSEAAGQPYRDRMLPLPSFLRDETMDSTLQDVANGFRMTGFFLRRDLFGPRGLDVPQARHALTAALGLPG